jgi:hypothetical protein
LKGNLREEEDVIQNSARDEAERCSMTALGAEMTEMIEFDLKIDLMA